MSRSGAKINNVHSFVENSQILLKTVNYILIKSEVEFVALVDREDSIAKFKIEGLTVDFPGLTFFSRTCQKLNRDS